MDFRQALAALLQGRSIANTDWDRPGMALVMHERTGMITEPFIAQTQANGICRVYTPTQADILGTNWGVVGEGKLAAQGLAHGAVGHETPAHVETAQRETAGSRS